MVDRFDVLLNLMTMIYATLCRNRRGSSSVIYFISFLLSILCLLQFSYGANNSSFDFPLGSIFTGTQTVLSQNGTFEAGLFSPPGSQYVYLGIWFALLEPRAIVWVANRNQQLSGNVSYACSASGELQVLDSGGKIAWSSGTKGQNVSGGVFKATGNLMLVGANESDIVWQSFDHPVNTWLPTMKIGLGRKLVSWQTASNPAEGRYSLHMTPAMEFVSMWEDQMIYWRTGTWNGHAFSGVPEMSNNTYFSFFFDNSTGFSWTILPSLNLIVRFIVDTDGLIKHEAWDGAASAWNAFWSQPHDQCTVYELCGPNGVCGENVSPFCSCPTGFQPTNAQEWSSNAWAGGCARQEKLQCSNDGFTPLSQTSFNASSQQVFLGLDSNDCSAACLRNCSCMAYNYDQINNECVLQAGALLDGKKSSTTTSTTYLKVASQGSTTGKQKWKKQALEAGLLSGAATLIVGACVIYVVMKRRLKWKESAVATSGGETIQRFKYVQLQAATKNFSEKLGSGGFGEVYKGWLASMEGKAMAVAVKKLLQQGSWQQGEKQFRSEMSTIGSIQHVNLVRLRGFCSEKMHRLLVYDYMQNGSLDSYLVSSSGGSVRGDGVTASAASGGGGAFSDSTSSYSNDGIGGDADTSISATSIVNHKVLDWPTRYRIALGSALGLAYLHDGCRQCIIHCDIKPENILLDSDFTAKVADFGLAKLVGREFSRVLTTIRGTRGYLAPEWIAGMPITPKADVYSFGMTLLELISGRRNLDSLPSLPPSDPSSDPHRRFFPVWAALCVAEGRDLVTELLDPRLLLDPLLAASVDPEQLRRIVFAAIWCIQEHETSRPTMRKIVHILDGSVQVSPPPMLESLRDLVMEGEHSYASSSPSFPRTTFPSWLDTPYKSSSSPSV